MSGPTQPLVDRPDADDGAGDLAPATGPQPSSACTMTRRAGLVASASALMPRRGLAQAAWPDRAVRLIVPFPPGSATDILSRSLAGPLGREIGQPIVVENRAGGNGVVGTGAAARSAPDGYTLLIYSTSTASVNPHTLRTLPFDPHADFAPIGFIAEMPYLLVVSPTHPAADMNAFVAHMRSAGQPATFSYGNSASLIAISLLARMTGATVQPVPYRGGAEALTDVMAQRVDATFTDLASGLAQLRAGKVRALGVTAAGLFPLTPDIPPVAVAVPGYEVTVWYGLAAPAGVSPAILSRAEAALARTLDHRPLAERFATLGYVPKHMGAAEFSAFLQAQFVLWRDRVRMAGIEPE
jgi:tripartite-type tricarboxylate transporter receptor subunit TctC